ncbi:bifunctional metallophosphatase/5'-nucleotidase [Sphingomonas profundi]|uniref:bifunctional metallophosphatase/5'-nucleotidase n=1 Tax=Alterirhizorhabdus profundi TaxID=2681549 RepID=UPI0012E7171E|nr:bifunctional metallophosphatase/5'-nucleotidase [Sphingomonas profundi]
MTSPRLARMLLAAAALASLSACAGTPPARRAGAPTVDVQILAFNDFHGNLEPPKLAITAPAPGGATVKVPAGGVAYLASALEARRKGHANSITVAAGDLVGASPLISALFLDEPTVDAMNLLGLSITSVGNHEFDRGRAEILRLAHGGCQKNTVREPCRIDRTFAGARYDILAANTLTEDGAPLLPGSVVRSFGSGAGRVRIGFVGMTLKGTATLVSPTGIAGLTFADEAETANALVPGLKAQEVDAIVLLIHQGGQTSVGYDDKSCADLSGDILPILAKLDPAFDLVVSGHTHKSYVCDYGRIDPTRPFLLTSAGQYGTLVTDILLRIDPAAHRVVARQADNVIVQGEGFGSGAAAVPVSPLYPRFPASPPLAALAATYAQAAAPLTGRALGRLSGPALRAPTASRESVLGDLVADTYLAATNTAATGRADLAFTNPGGVRADLVPAADGTVTYGQLFTVLPFANTLVVRSYTGRQIRAALEQQFSGTHSPAAPYVLLPSANMRYAYDLSRPEGQRILDATVSGRPLDDAARYRVTVNNFLAGGGDGFAALAEGTDSVGGPIDLDAFEAYLAGDRVVALPVTDRIANRTPQ